jgi:hypothetical protein
VLAGVSKVTYRPYAQDYTVMPRSALRWLYPVNDFGDDPHNVVFFVVQLDQLAITQRTCDWTAHLDIKQNPQVLLSRLRHKLKELLKSWHRFMRLQSGPQSADLCPVNINNLLFPTKTPV